MAVLTVIPESNVHFADIRDTLNNHGGNVTNEVVTAFTQGNINKWARNKPMDYNKNFGLTEQEKLSINYGFTNIPVFSRIGYMFNFVNGNTNSPNIPNCGLQPEYFTYNPPKGGVQSPYRLDDFVGYSPYASCFVGRVNNPNWIVTEASTTIPISYENIPNKATSVMLNEMIGIYGSNYYLGVALVGDGVVRYITHSTPITTDATDVFSWQLSNISASIAGRYKVFMFLSDTMFATTQSSVNSVTGASFIPLLFTVNDATLREKETSLILNLSAYRITEESLRFIYYNLNISNRGGDSVYVPMVNIEVYDEDGILIADGGAVINSTIEAGGTHNISKDSILVSNIMIATTMRVWVEIDGKTFATSAIITDTLPRD